MIEREIVTGHQAVFVRDAGDAQGSPVIYFHGTPGSRLDVAFGDEIAERLGVRVVSFDRPGYGMSDPAPYSLVSVAHDVAAIADTLGLDQFATFGWSGGGPFALAAAAVLGERIVRTGVAGGIAPLQLLPGGVEGLTDNDRLALSFLPDAPDRAAEQFSSGNEDQLQLMMSVRDDEQAPWIDWLWGATDPAVVSDPAMRRQLYSVLHEGLRQGTTGIAWDNVAWCGPWGFDLDDILCPVDLWYGSLDEMVPPTNGEWLRSHLSTARLVVHPDEGHLLPLRHWEDMLETLLG